MIIGFWFGFNRICKCWGTYFFLSQCFLDKNLDKPLYPFASLTDYSCRTDRPYESELSTVNLYAMNRWRLCYHLAKVYKR